MTAAASLLALYGTVSALAGLQDGLDVVPILGGLALLLTAVAVLWAGRSGHWLGLTVTALLTLLALRALTRHWETGVAALSGFTAVPLLLLAVPAARRPRPRPRHQVAAPVGAPELDLARAPARAVDRRGFGGVAAVILAAASLIAGGLGMLWSAHGSERGVGASLTLFGLALAIGSPLVAPKRRRGRLTLETVHFRGRWESGVAFPYSRTTVVVSLSALLLSGLAMLGLVALAAPPLPIRLLGIVGAAFLLFLVTATLRRGAGRAWRVVLSPSAVVYARGRPTLVIPWTAINRVTELAATYLTGGAVARERFVRLVLTGSHAVQRSGVATRLLIGRGDEVRLPLNALDVSPTLLCQALRHYHRNPSARHELASVSGLQRVRRAEFDDPGGDPA